MNWFWIAVIVGAWTWFGANAMENMDKDTPKGMKAIGYCFILGPLLGTLLAAIIFWEMGFGKDKEKRKKEQERHYEGDAILKKVKACMDNPANYQYEVNGQWIARDEAIKQIIADYFKKY